MLEGLESSLIDDPAERKKEQMSKASAFIKSFDSVNDLISDIFEYNLVSVEDALVALVGDTVLEPTKESSEFLQKVRSSESLFIDQAAELKERMETVDKALTSLKNRTSFNLSKLIITVSNQRELDEIIKDIETVTGAGYALHINELTIENIEGLTSINLCSIPKSTIALYRLDNLNSLETINFGQVENVDILCCDQLKTIQGTAKTWILFELNALRTVDVGQAENVHIEDCFELETIQGTAKTWELRFLYALKTINIGQAENAYIKFCGQLETIKGTAKTWMLLRSKTLTTVDVGQAENVHIESCDQLKTIQGTAKTWKLESLKTLTTADVGQAENVRIRLCEQLQTIKGTAKTWILRDLKTLTTVDVNKAETVDIMDCRLYKT